MRYFVLFFFIVNPLLSLHIEGPLTHTYSVKEGDEMQGSIRLVNASDKVEEILLYLVDYRFDYLGRSEYLDPSTLERSNAAWIFLHDTQVSLQPHSTQEVYYSFKIEELLEGTYWSMVLVEPLLNDSFEEQENALTMRTVWRYGIQIITNFNGGEAQIKLLERRVVQDEHQSYLVVDVSNEGTRLITPKMWLDLFLSSEKRHLEDSPKKIYPGCSVRMTLPLGKLEEGTYQTFFLLDGGADGIFGGPFELQIE